MALPKGFELIQDQSNAQSGINLPPGFQLTGESSLDLMGGPLAGRLRKEIGGIPEGNRQLRTASQQPQATGLGFLEGLSNVANIISGSLSPNEALPKEQFSPEQQEAAEVGERGGQFLGSLAIPLPFGKTLKNLLPKEPTAKQLARQEARTAKNKQLTESAIEREKVMKTFEKPSAEEVLSREPKDHFGQIEKSLKDTLEPFTKEVAFEERIAAKPFKTSEEAVGSLRSEIKKIEKPIAEKFDQEYEKMGKIAKNIEVLPTKLFHDADQLLKSIPEIKISSFGNKEKKLVSALEELINQVAEVTPNGNLIGYKPIDVQKLIDIKRQIGSSRNLDGKLKRLYGLVEDAISEGLATKGKSVLNRYKDLNKRYSEFINDFFPDNLEKLKNAKNLNFNKTFSDLIDADTFRDLERILNRSQRGRELLDKLRREIFSKSAKSGLTSREANELKQVLGKGKENLVDSFIARQKPKPKFTAQEPEELLSRMNSRSSIRRLKKELDVVRGGDRLFKDLKEAKVDEILSRGKIHPNSTVKEVYDLLNNKKNFEILSELEGAGPTFEQLQVFGKELETKKYDKIAKMLMKNIGKETLKTLPGGYLFYRLCKSILHSI